MQSTRGNLIYTAFATAVFTVFQYLMDVQDPLSLAVGAIMFFVFTFFMLRLINRITVLFLGDRVRQRREREAAAKEPPVIAATTSRPEHARRRRERRGRRGRR